jgi:hypothetical protein
MERHDEGRRRFLGVLAGFLLTGKLPELGRTRRVRTVQSKHPEPRPNITAERVLTAEQLADHPDAIPVFDMVREIPMIVDGIRCQCGCAEVPDFYSLLSCFEVEGMARHCEVCKGQAKLVHRLYKQGKKLKEIRGAIDAEYGK